MSSRSSHPPSPWVYCLATWFGLGRLPKAPGTWGSLGALIFLIPLYAVSWPIFAAIILLFFIIGWYCSWLILPHADNHDPSFIVIDEVVGVWLMAFLIPPMWWTILLGFVLFRIFDIWKPWPVSWADGLRGGRGIIALGIMLDDILAALYSVVTLYVIFWLIGQSL